MHESAKKLESLLQRNPPSLDQVRVRIGHTPGKSTATYEQRLQAQRLFPTFLHYLPRWQAARRKERVGREMAAMDTYFDKLDRIYGR